VTAVLRLRNTLTYLLTYLLIYLLVCEINVHIVKNAVVRMLLYQLCIATVPWRKVLNIFFNKCSKSSTLLTVQIRHELIKIKIVIVVELS